MRMLFCNSLCSQWCEDIIICKDAVLRAYKTETHVEGFVYAESAKYMIVFSHFAFLFLLTLMLCTQHCILNYLLR